jgi:hypothetical protein
MIAPILNFLLPRSTFSTCAITNGRNDLVKTSDTTSDIPRRSPFTRPKKVNFNDRPSFPEKEYLTYDQPPPSSRHSPPFLKIIMSPDAQVAPAAQPGNFRLESSAVKSLTGSTISLGEREVFAKIFDQMLTNPIPIETTRRQRFVQSKRVAQPTDSMTATSKRVSLLAGMDDSLFLTSKEVAEYPAALRPLAARVTRDRDNLPTHNTLERNDWNEIEKVMDSCLTDLELSRYLELSVFSIIQDPSNTRQSPIHFNYSLILLKAMRLFRTTFRNPLAAHTLFLRAKTLSAESYVLGCTTQLYNELLLSRWESFTDLYSITEILDEMSTNGLKGDGQTIQILQRIQDDVHDWATQGAEAARVVWLAERERMVRLEKMQRDIVERIESEVQQDDMALDLEREVRSLQERRV